MGIVEFVLPYCYKVSNSLFNKKVSVGTLFDSKKENCLRLVNPENKYCP